MKLIIAGGRDYRLTTEDYVRLEKINNENDLLCVVSGCASGADSCGELWANGTNIPVKKFPADWKTHGKKAGPLRNAEMAEYADAVALFPGGEGTDSMYREAKKAGLKIFDFRENEQ